MNDKELVMENYKLLVEWEKKIIESILTTNYYYYSFVGASIFFIYSNLEKPSFENVRYILIPHVVFSILLSLVSLTRFRSGMKFCEDEMQKSASFLFGSPILKEEEKPIYNKLLESNECQSALNAGKAEICWEILEKGLNRKIKGFTYIAASGSIWLLIISAIGMALTAVGLIFVITDPYLRILNKWF